jgi:uncharacterized protein YqgV (UPF0045/DUF77 family)
MIASAPVSIYPMGQEHIGPAVATVATALEAHGLSPEVGPMSTHIVGEAAAIFAALCEAFAAAAEAGQVVMTLTISNACPIAT